MLTVPYIGAQEFADTFPDVDISRYVPSGTPAQSQSLIALLRRASSLADQWCKQLLRATVDTETVSIYPTKQYTLRIWPKYRPIVQLTNLQYRYSPKDGWTNVYDLSAAGGLEQFDNYFDYSGTWFHQLYKVSVEYTYVNGFPVTQLSSNVTAGAQSINVNDSTGIVKGTVLTLYDSNSEDVVVSSVNGDIVNLASPITDNHNTDIQVSGVPNAISLATGMIAANLIQRGMDGAVEVGDEDFKTQYKGDSIITSDIQTLLKPYQINR